MYVVIGFGLQVIPYVGLEMIYRYKRFHSKRINSKDQDCHPQKDHFEYLQYP
jgi:hypothetical protein